LNLTYDITAVDITKKVQNGAVAVITKEEATHPFHNLDKDRFGQQKLYNMITSLRE
jgi:hypothetical protein